MGWFNSNTANAVFQYYHCMDMAKESKWYPEFWLEHAKDWVERITIWRNLES
jgi:hypothetical protein